MQQTFGTHKISKPEKRRKKKSILDVGRKRPEKQARTKGEEVTKKKENEEGVECKPADTDPTETKPVSPESQSQK